MVVTQELVIVAAVVVIAAIIALKTCKKIIKLVLIAAVVWLAYNYLH